MAIGRIPEPGTGIPESIIAAKGDLIAGTANDTPGILTAGSNETRLVADSSTATGLKYVADTTNYAIAAKGDLLVGTGADTLAALTVGTNGHTLVADSSTATGLKWAAPAGASFVGVSLSNSTDPTIANSTDTALTWNGELFDTDGFHSTTTNTSRITIPSGKAGKYLIVGSCDFDNNTTGYRMLQIFKNGAQAAYTIIPASSVFPTSNLSLVADLAVNDYVELVVFQNSGGSRQIFITATNGQFSAVYLGA